MQSKRQFGKVYDLDTFIQQAKEIHGDLYDYSLSIYKTTALKLKVKCNRCQVVFEVRPNNHISKKSGCSQCNRKGKAKLTQQEFVNVSKNTHCDKYDYSESVYTGGHDYVNIKCNRCNIMFKQTASAHMFGQGCQKCHRFFQKSNTEDFIQKALKIHGEGKFDYSFVNYEISHIKVSIKCNKCNVVFQQKPNSHLNGDGCKNCCKGTTQQFIEDSKQIFGELYEYDLTVYTSYSEPLLITCKLHGPFKKAPSNHISLKQGCPKCTNFKSQQQIADFLSEHYQVSQEMTFPDGFYPWTYDNKYRKRFRYDICLNDLNIIIECDGIQHFEDDTYFSKHTGLAERNKCDKYKDQYALDRGYSIIRVSQPEMIKNNWHSALEHLIYDILLDSQPRVLYIGDLYNAQPLLEC